MSTLPTFIAAGTARAASQESALLARAAAKAMGAMEWTLAASQFRQAADLLPLDPHTGQENIQARAHRRSVRHCEAMALTRTPELRICDAPEYGAMRRATIAKFEREWVNT